MLTIQYNYIATFVGKDFALFYDYSGLSISVDLTKLVYRSGDAYWFDPITGVYSYISSFDIQDKSKTFISPKRSSGQNDWVLVLKLCSFN